VLKFCDFGFAVELSKDGKLKIRGPKLGGGQWFGSFRYMGPEAMDKKGITIDKLGKLDSYALGVLLLELITGTNGELFLISKGTSFKEVYTKQKGFPKKTLLEILAIFHKEAARRFIPKRHPYKKVVIGLLEGKPTDRLDLDKLILNKDNNYEIRSKQHV